MAPSIRRRRRRRKSSSRRSTTLLKKHLHNKNDQENSLVSPANSPAKLDSSTENVDICSTPKADRYRIPETQTCPPAPKKRRIITSCNPLRRRPIAFYASPDIELFFYLALRGIPV
ncbi:hypothetical protein CDL12_15032 [Handroanthus impetiginosus]|uniref:Uncharacterized protein n=1 Tax=Handroanthus impetiginosus TaxID=429701 RepID=A0A2G9H4A9_9LAMI|nr:hypothetical protein CDL12_15032 [Handroanthus impetiginosus]